MLILTRLIKRSKWNRHVLQLISPWRKWPPPRGRPIQLHFREWKLMYFHSNFTEICSQGSSWQQPSIGSDNGLALKMRQAIISANADPVHWRICVAPGGDELTTTAFHNVLIQRRCDILNNSMGIFMSRIWSWCQMLMPWHEMVVRTSTPTMCLSHYCFLQGCNSTEI